MENILLAFFYERSNVLKESIGFTQSDNSKIVSKFTFKVSNFRTDKDNTIEVDSLESLNSAVKSYYEETDNNFKDFISIPEFLKEDEPMFVHLQLP